MNRLTRVARIAGALTTAFCAAAACAGVLPGLGVVTVVDGDGSVWREHQRFAVAEGQRLQAEDIVATAGAARLVRVEFDDGRVLDLGPGTQALLQPAALARLNERPPTAYLLQGWAKLAAPLAAPAALMGPRLDVQRIAGSTIVAAPPADLPWLHVEAGSAQAQPHDAARRLPTAPTPLAEAQVFALRATGSSEVAERLSPAQRALLPRSFVDGVPRRAARFSVAAEPGPATAVGYDEAAPWINAEAALRPSFVARLAPRLQDAAFRKAVLADMRQHPEWQRLFPPPAPPRAIARPAAPAARPAAPPPADDPVPASDLRAELP